MAIIKPVCVYRLLAPCQILLKTVDLKEVYVMGEDRY